MQVENLKCELKIKSASWKFKELKVRVENLKEDYFWSEAYFCSTGSFIASQYHRPGKTPAPLEK